MKVKTFKSKFTIESVTQIDYQELIELWEASVRATHLFLKDEDISFFKQVILHQYFDVVKLFCIKNEHQHILGFMGIADTNLEMLFVMPSYFGLGIGKALLLEAISKQGVKFVDVNEQNPKALGFYLHHGFKICSRSEKDGTGKPYPILHLKLI
jgi:putative acetyltransferase